MKKKSKKKRKITPNKPLPLTTQQVDQHDREICPFCDTVFHEMSKDTLCQFRCPKPLHVINLNKHSLRNHPGTPIPQGILIVQPDKDFQYESFIHHLQARCLKAYIKKMSPLNCLMFDPKQKVLTLVSILMQLNLTKDIHEYFKGSENIPGDIEEIQKKPTFFSEIIEDCYNNKIDMSM